MILMIDNYDSFTYNLVQYLGELGEELVVVRNDEITLEEIERLNPKYLMISPGPGNPDGAGISLSAISHFEGKLPILGVCLGHQAIGQVYGAKVVRAKKRMHGKSCDVTHDGKTIYSGLSQPLTVGRYHSLIVAPTDFPEELEITSVSPDGEIMGLRHKKFPIEGVQYHPESILTIEGKALLQNFIDTYREWVPK